jgi:hypothetical protein
MFQDTVMQKHPVFGHPHFRMLQANFLPQMAKHLLVLLLRNRLMCTVPSKSKRASHSILSFEKCWQNSMVLRNFHMFTLGIIQKTPGFVTCD